MPDQISMQDIAHAMKKHGGSFVAALGEALIRADDSNAMKLEAAFPEYFRAYAEWAKRDQEAS